MRASLPTRRHAKTRLLVLLGVMAVAASAFSVPNAMAAGEIGPFGRPTVTCNNIANQLLIEPHIGAGQAYARQKLAYQITYYKYNTTTRAWDGPTYVTFNGSYWNTFTHQRIGWFYNQAIFTWQQYTEDWATAPSATVPVDHGQYYVYIKYAWEISSGVWWDRNGSRLGDYSPWESPLFLWPGLAGYQTYCIV